MLNEAGLFLIDTIVQPFAAVLLFRFYAVWLHVPMRNPLGDFFMAITDFIVLPARKFLGMVSNFDRSTLLLAFVAEFIYLVFFLWIQNYPYTTFPLLGLFAWTAVKLLKISVYLLIVTLLAEAILSWVNPHTTIAPMLSAFNRPFVQPLRRHLPLIGPLDISILLLLIFCQLFLIVVVGGLERSVMALL